MGTRIGILLIFIAGLFFNSLAQTEIDECFKNLKNGGILVQLRSNYMTLNAIKGKNDQLYNKIIRERDKRNQEIIDAFKSFTYCPVYFFYSNNSKLIYEKKFENTLLNVNLDTVKPSPNLHFNYLIAVFDATREDTAKFCDYNSRFLTHNNETGNLERRYRWYNHSMEGGIDAFILLSPDFYYLTDPYPHYYRTYERLWILKRSKLSLVELMEDEIAGYNSFNFGIKR